MAQESAVVLSFNKPFFILIIVSPHLPPTPQYLLPDEMKNQGENIEKSTNAFTARRKEGACYECGEHRHFVRKCQDVGQAGHSGATWRVSTRGRGRNRGGRGNVVRGRGNFRQQGASTCERSREGANAWIAMAHATHSSEANSLCNNELEWLLDNVLKCIELKEPVNIYLGDNRSVKATKIGNVVTYFNAFGNLNEVNIKNVF